MSTTAQFYSGTPATRTIVNAFSAGGTSVGALAANAGTNMAREVLSGALTANTLGTVVSITGSGQISYLTAYSKNATARTIRLVIVLDGVTVFDATSNSISVAGTGLLAVGMATDTGTRLPSSPIRFNSSCLIQVASSLTETDNVAVAYSLA